MAFEMSYVTKVLCYQLEQLPGRDNVDFSESEGANNNYKKSVQEHRRVYYNRNKDYFPVLTDRIYENSPLQVSWKSPDRICDNSSDNNYINSPDQISDICPDRISEYSPNVFSYQRTSQTLTESPVQSAGEIESPLPRPDRSSLKYNDDVSIMSPDHSSNKSFDQLPVENMGYSTLQKALSTYFMKSLNLKSSRRNNPSTSFSSKDSSQGPSCPASEKLLSPDKGNDIISPLKLDMSEIMPDFTDYGEFGAVSLPDEVIHSSEARKCIDLQHIPEPINLLMDTNNPSCDNNETVGAGSSTYGVKSSDSKSSLPLRCNNKISSKTNYVCFKNLDSSVPDSNLKLEVLVKRKHNPFNQSWKKGSILSNYSVKNNTTLSSEPQTSLPEYNHDLALEPTASFQCIKCKAINTLNIKSLKQMVETQAQTIPPSTEATSNPKSAFRTNIQPDMFINPDSM